MERQLQERLIGATVLTIVAVLVVPELLSGPKPEAAPPVASVSQPPTMIVGAVEVPRAPLPSRGTAPKPVGSPIEPTSSTGVAPAKTGSAPVVRPPATSPSRVAGAPAVSVPVEVGAPLPQALPKSGDKHSAGKGGWSIQVGSYANAATAKRIAKDLQNHGFAAVVLPVDLQGKRLYRVRVGPATDRKTADQTLRRVRRLMPSSRLVGNP